MRGNYFARFIDRYFGIIIIFIYGIIRNKRIKPSSLKKIAIFKSAAIGDMVLITAILNDLQKINKFEITLILGQDNSQILPLVENYSHHKCININRPFQAIKRIRDDKYDCFIDLGSWPRIDAIISAFSKSKYTVGFKTSGQFRHYAYDHCIFHNKEIHELDNYRNILKSIIDISFISNPKLIPMSKLEFNENKFILIHMWPGGYKSHNKEWNKTKWEELIVILRKEGYKVVLSGTKEDKIGNQRILNGFNDKEVIDISGEYTLVELSNILDKSLGVISVNTGIAHMASALNKPTVCLNGPTSPIRWGPLGGNVKNVNSVLYGAGFLNLGFEYNLGPQNTMAHIDVQSVYDNLFSLIN